MNSVNIKQIILVTDGRSNIGGNPITMASEAMKYGITVNAIGIMDDRDEDAFREIEGIAQAGGGVWENSKVNELGYTMQMVTQKTVNKTIQTIVGNQLREIIGKDIKDIPPNTRGKVVEYIEQLGEEATVQCCILMDCSGSMNHKICMAKQSIIELMNSFKGRKGKYQVAVVAYPGDHGEFSKLVVDFTSDIEELKNRVLEAKTGGTTPTAAAISRAIQLFNLIEKIENKQEMIHREPLLQESII